MREIKFRQAITDTDGTFRWHYWGYLHVDTTGLPVFINPLGSVEWDKRESYQQVGRQDKNKDEIYERDLLWTPGGQILKVEIPDLINGDGKFRSIVIEECELEEKS